MKTNDSLAPSLIKDELCACRWRARSTMTAITITTITVVLICAPFIGFSNGPAGSLAAANTLRPTRRERIVEVV